MDYVCIFIEPEGEIEEAERFLLSVAYTKRELLSFGLDRNSDDLNREYLGLDELTKLKNLWSDPLYLRLFYKNNEDKFRDYYWQGINRNSFVKDIIKYSPGVFNELEKRFYNNTLDKLFKPLINDTIISNNISQTKSIFGKICGRYAFRIYAIRVDNGSYIITGGSIKIVRRMEDSTNTAVELQKINLIYKELKEGEVANLDTFFDFIQ